MKDARAYSIAGFELVVSGPCLRAMDQLPEFSGFLTGNEALSKESLTVLLDCGEPQLVRGTLFHHSCNLGISSSFYHSETYYGLEQTVDGSIQTSLVFDEKTKECSIAGNLDPVLLRYALWVAFNRYVLDHQAIAVHSSTVICENEAYMFLGESGTGKSTHTRLIRERFPEIELLNDDSPFVRVENGACRVYGSPWSGKTPCYKQMSANYGGAVRLTQAPINEIRRCSLEEAITVLFPSLPPEIYRCGSLQPELSPILSVMLKQAPAYSLKCLPDEAAAELSIGVILKS